MKNRRQFTLGFWVCAMLTFCVAFAAKAQNNLSVSARATSSSSLENHDPNLAIDSSPESYWSSQSEDENAWLVLRFPGATEVVKIEINFAPKVIPNNAFHLQYLLNGEWRTFHKVTNNKDQKVEVDLTKPQLIDRVRLLAMDGQIMQVSEVLLLGQKYADTSGLENKPVLVNQSGYNLNRSKRFTAPGIKDHTPFAVVNVKTGKEEFTGKVMGEKGDFSNFNPLSEDEFLIKIKELESYPFRIGPNWIERVTYRNMVDFMMGARHYIGTVDDIRKISFAWRDGDFFNWSMQSLVAMYLSNPEAYERMERKGRYVSNDSFPDNYKGLWGKLEPFAAETPDIVQLIHWDADVKISQQLDHEMQKAELAHFLYAWPYLKQWLPQQNFDLVYQYVKDNWEKETVSEHSLSQYNLSKEHNLLSLKTQLGTTKGEMPPGFSVIPNLMLYEVAKREGDAIAEKFFEAAHKQLDWMINNLDWSDPMTTKGQRMSEHMTMRAFAYFYQQFPDRAPEGIPDKVKEWAQLMLDRSENLWDFRKYSADEWTPPGWNETGNILGFPAAVFAANGILEDKALINDMEMLAWSHIENAFGRNPTGRQFSYKGPEEVEGVDLGWYSRHRGGIGLLDEVQFVFDGSPKSFHYPNFPEVGDLGWTEGWVQFNTAFNLSMAYMAHYYTAIALEKLDEGKYQIALTAPINFDYKTIEKAALTISNLSGDTIVVELEEAQPLAVKLTGEVEFTGDALLFENQRLPFGKNDSLTLSYGYGFFQRTLVISATDFK
ncbi:discoidin domain-containing protein [Cyclobacterium sp. 1_MG-2023]|uniref:discoidin domain-containing protein n=1 Tax=Cyclobacterium sp. 1_MG-2023 TaxID=3062681 RepID=UPI0026E3D463|nr:discoidin domain-containing protein [Cyclobacterium sp. 1_MG-2023]MDO6438934.1 discoidin domain-containing protein [Cyclobacterium sp. 1_MG-2023]